MEFIGADRVVIGKVKRAYPLQSLHSGPRSAGGELGTFGPCVGPCGPEASQIMAVVIENLRTTFESCWVFFYDKWATKMQFLKRHYKIWISGRGLVALEWEAGADTEERTQCVIAAEGNVLKKSLDRQPRLFTFPHSLNIEVVYEEPQRLPDSDQLHYLPSKTITTRDLHSGTIYDVSRSLVIVEMTNSVDVLAAASRQTLIQSRAPPRKKLNHGKRTLGIAKMMSPAYKYSPLSDLVDGYADIYGVVVNITLPKKTGGRDFCMTVSVTDESCPTRDKALQINVFYPTIIQMPQIKYVGDIVRFHKVKIQQYQDKIQGVGMSRATRHLVLREGDGGKLEQLAYSENWTFEQSDEERTRELIKWSKRSLDEDITLPYGCLNAPKLLADLKLAEGFIDIVVRVFHLDDSEEPVRLIIWDGSGNVTDSDPVLVHALTDRNIFVPANGLLKEVIMTSCWSLVRDMGFVDGMLTHWCRFRNLAVATDDPIPGTVVAPGRQDILRFREVTSFVLMPEFALDVQRRLALIGNGSNSNSDTTVANDQTRDRSPMVEPLLNSNNISRPMVAITVIPDYIQKNIPVTPMREILNSLQTPRKFHCCARICSIWPTDIEKICKLKSGTNGKVFIYSFALTVEEGSNSMNIIVYGKDAEHFLHGIPPCDLSKSTNSKALLEKRFAALLNTRNTFHWCIKSYLVSLPPGDPSSATIAVRYRLFDTLLQCF